MAVVVHQPGASSVGWGSDLRLTQLHLLLGCPIRERRITPSSGFEIGIAASLHNVGTDGVSHMPPGIVVVTLLLPTSWPLVDARCSPVNIVGGGCLLGPGTDRRPGGGSAGVWHALERDDTRRRKSW